MEKLLELEKDESIKVSSNVLNYEKPDYVYIPIIKDASLLININDHIEIGTPLYKTKNEVVTSPISGIIKDLKIVNNYNGKIKALKIANDFQEKKRLEPASKISLNKIQKERLAKLLILQFKIDMTNKKVLILNAVDDDIYILTLNFYLLLYYEGFLEILDKLAKIFNLEKVIICVKETSGENINKLMECLGMYPNIELKIVPNLYLLGKDNFLIKHLNYNENDTIVIKTNKLYDIYNLIKRNRQKTDQLITISGNGVVNPSIVNVRVGTLLKDVINNLITISSDNISLIGNNLMNGKVINLDNFIIDENLDGVLIMQNKKDKQPEECINCGLCIEMCPVNINPLLLKNKTYLDKVNNRCIRCGICSYICPVYINFNKYFKGGSYE